MEDDEFRPDQYPAAVVAATGWQSTLFIGAVTLILGIIVTAHPSASLNVIAVLVGILALVSGVFHLVRSFDRTERRRTWQGISGLLFIVIGVLLIRDLNLTVAAIGLLVGISWIVQGIASLILAFGAGPGAGAARLWWAVFGFISLIAGIVVTASPVKSVTVLAVLLGIWFIIMGVFEIALALMVRHAISSGHGREQEREQGRRQQREEEQRQGQAPGRVPGQAGPTPEEASQRSADRGASSQ
jgi:uncharacterized membrane protein HdeD (DUF308 family)